MLNRHYDGDLVLTFYNLFFRGITPEQAELNFLDNVRKLPMYGVHRHLALVSSFPSQVLLLVYTECC